MLGNKKILHAHVLEELIVKVSILELENVNPYPNFQEG